MGARKTATLPHGSSTEERFWPKVAKADGDECWLWVAAIAPQTGYGAFWDGERVASAHVYSFLLAGGTIPDGMTVDHECRVRACVRPSHLRVLTRAANVLAGESPHAVNARKTHCIRGHELTGDNVFTWQGARRCRTCINDRRRATYAARKEAKV